MEIDYKDLTASQKIERVRGQLFDARSALEQIVRDHGYADFITCAAGLLSCGLVTLAWSKEEVAKREVVIEDSKRGVHLPFRSRGIGLDRCTCFVCGVDTRPPYAYLHNIAAFVRSEEEGEEIVRWFNGRARLDFRPSEPTWIQIKVGACDAHLPNLKFLDRQVSRHGVIRQADIDDAIDVEENPSDNSKEDEK